VIDLVPFYPDALVLPLSKTIREFYITTYRDRFFVEPPSWFKGYLALEALYHIPATLWFLQALPKDDQLVPLHLLIFALETGITTMTCLVEMLGWEGYNTAEKRSLLSLYGPYLGVGKSQQDLQDSVADFNVAVLMGADAFLRLRQIIFSKSKQI
jgi:hypothetical protein